MVLPRAGAAPQIASTGPQAGTFGGVAGVPSCLAGTETVKASATCALPAPRALAPRLTAVRIKTVDRARAGAPARARANTHTQTHTHTHKRARARSRGRLATLGCVRVGARRAWSLKSFCCCGCGAGALTRGRARGADAFTATGLRVSTSAATGAGPATNGGLVTPIFFLPAMSYVLSLTAIAGDKYTYKDNYGATYNLLINYALGSSGETTAVITWRSVLGNFENAPAAAATPACATAQFDFTWVVTAHTSAVAAPLEWNGAATVGIVFLVLVALFIIWQLWYESQVEKAKASRKLGECGRSPRGGARRALFRACVCVCV
jgi:hypothetical protein